MEYEFPIQRPHEPSVLVIDDDPGTRETFDCALTAHGLTVATAGSGAEGMALARRRLFDLIVIDLCLPDMLGTDLARALRRELPNARFIVVSGFLTTPMTVEAVRVGAIDVMEKPVAVEHLVATVDSILRDAPPPPPPLGDTADVPKATESSATIRSSAQRSRSAAQRWAMNVLKACEFHADIRTLDDWADCVGQSYSSLCESCRLLGIRPHDARDLARVLRAIITSCGRSDVGVHLDISDMRTLKRILDRAGLDHGSAAGSIPVDHFLERQHFVETDNEGLTALRKLLATRFTHR